MRFRIVPISESIFQKIDGRGYFTNEKMSSQELYDCSWNFDSTEIDYLVAFFTLAATGLHVPPGLRKTGKDLNWDNSQQRCHEFEAYRFLFLNAIMTEQAIRFYKKNDFMFAEENDQQEIEQDLEKSLFVDDKESVVPMFFDLNSLA